MKSRYLLSVLFLIGAVCFGQERAFAWGDEGHQIVCSIAYKELTPSARQKVDSLIAQDSEFRAFPQACTWMDHPRKRKVEHYVNIPRNATQIMPADLCPGADKCVVTAILNDMRDLALTTRDADQLSLIKSLGHWVGDIHQPLHVSFEDDHGAGFINGTSPCNTDLHGVWDTCIIEQTLGEDPETAAIEIRSEIDSTERAAWTKGDVDEKVVLGWANTSLEISLAPGTEYCVKVGNECHYTSDEVSFDGHSKKTVTTDEAYIERQAPLVKKQLQMAGVRLGYIINRIFSTTEDVAALNAPSFSLERVLLARGPLPVAPPINVEALQPIAGADIGNNTSLQAKVDELTTRIRVLELALAGSQARQ
ncbi:S1/P1 nuclease [Mesorhizobium sp. M0244]|uniref:S1/P1 nuclease n=1 Tax=Mesorhizobium sp. M0244 TaxID=2956926 RepID=UPI00333E035C